MAKLVSGEACPARKIISIERITGLNEFAKMNLLKYGFLERTIELILGDGSYGYMGRFMIKNCRRVRGGNSRSVERTAENRRPDCRAGKTALLF